MNDEHEELVTCIGCGCDDFDACEGADGEPCHWLRVDEERQLGVCSECLQHVARFDAGDRGLSAEAIRTESAEDEGLILPGDDDYDETLAELRRR